MKITKTGYVGTEFVTFLTEEATASKIKELMHGLEHEQHLTIVNESGLELAMAKYSDSEYFMDLTEISIGGVRSTSYAEKSKLNIDLILNCFVMFLIGDMKTLSLLVDWQPQEDPIKAELEATKKRESYLAQELEDRARMERRITEEDAEMAKLLELVAQHTDSTQATKDETPVYNPSIWDTSKYGNHNKKIICPHCTEIGYVHTKKVSKKAGISGGKASAAILTAGFSLLALGLSRSEKVIESYCANCESTW